MPQPISWHVSHINRGVPSFPVLQPPLRLTRRTFSKALAPQPVPAVITKASFWEGRWGCPGHRHLDRKRAALHVPAVGICTSNRTRSRSGVTVDQNLDRDVSHLDPIPSPTRVAQGVQSYIGQITPKVKDAVAFQCLREGLTYQADHGVDQDLLCRPSRSYTW